MSLSVIDLEEQVAKLELEMYRVDHRPIIRAYMQRLGVIELINTLVPTEMEVEPGLIVAGMIQDTFSGRSPLYRLKDFFQTQDTELLLGQQVDTEIFADYNVGRVMDRIHKVGTSRIFAEVSRRAAILFELDLTVGHWDSTSVSVWGDYDVYTDEEDERLRITHGYSKDHRPDLKQFLIQMLCVEHNIPIMGDCQDGNSSDKVLNNKMLGSISRTLAKHGIEESAFTYIADSAVVLKENLAYFGPQPNGSTLYFVTRLPFNYTETDRVVAEAVAANNWQPIGQLAAAKSTPKRPVAQYRAYETQVTLYGIPYRAIVIHSSAHDKRRQKRIDRELAESEKFLTQQIEKSQKRIYFCEADAQIDLATLLKQTSPYHRIEGQITERLIYARGRPNKDGTRRIAQRNYVIEATVIEEPEAAARKRAEAGCFVLLSNRPLEGADAQTAEQLLRSYKDQDGVEQNFRFLKDPLIVNDLFLKTPERIEVLGMILLICLMIWNLMQRSMRNHIEDTGQAMRGWANKPTTRPTTFMMQTKFMGIHILKSGRARMLAKPLTETQQHYLLALGVTAKIFTDPRPPPKR